MIKISVSKTRVVTLVFVFLTAAFSIQQQIFAQNAQSDCVVTRIGNPKSGSNPPQGCGQSGSPKIPPSSGAKPPNSSAASCPGVGPISCGTKGEGCHCSASYQNSVCGGSCSWCNPPPQSSDYAIDITNPLNGDVVVPKIYIPETKETHTVTCKGYGNICLDASDGCLEPEQIIQTLSCKDDKTGDAVWMHFHHSSKSMPVEVGRYYQSGDVVGRSAEFHVLQSEPHVHFQLGIEGPCEAAADGLSGCRNADEYVKCG